MTFYSKLTQELKKQFKTSNIHILETRAKCMAVAQHIQEGLYGLDQRKSLYGSDEKKSFIDRSSPTTGPKYPYISSKRDYKD